MVDNNKDPCGNEKCDACYPLPRWNVTTVTVRRIAHEREVKAATAEEALSVYTQGTAWPETYDERTLEVLEENEPAVTQVTDENKLKYYQEHLCWHKLHSVDGS